MVKIYTRTGDKGQTSFFGGKRVGKDDIRVEAIGSVDELNSAIGLVLSEVRGQPPEVRKELVKIQHDLFDIGSMLANPQVTSDKLQVTSLEHRVLDFEKLIDVLTSKLSPLSSFILPGGGKGGAMLHLTRSISRRAERRVIALAKKEQVPSEIIIYLNRLSDLLFTMARFANYQEKQKEVIWVKSV